MKPRTRLLIAGAAAAATTANAIRPVGRRRLAVPAFALGLGPSEFPLHTALFQLAVGGLLTRRGGSRGCAGSGGGDQSRVRGGANDRAAAPTTRKIRPSTTTPAIATPVRAMKPAPR